MSTCQINENISVYPIHSREMTGTILKKIFWMPLFDIYKYDPPTNELTLNQIFVETKLYYDKACYTLDSINILEQSVMMIRVSNNTMVEFM